MALTIELENRVCPYCKQTMAVNVKHAAAVVAHMACVMAANESTREQLRESYRRKFLPAK